MKSRMSAAIVASAVMLTAPVLVPAASAQPVQSGGSSSYIVPIVVGAAAGATVGALLWPALIPAAAAAPTATMAMAAPAAGWGWGAFMTTRAAVGAVIGGALGWVVAR